MKWTVMATLACIGAASLASAQTADEVPQQVTDLIERLTATGTMMQIVTDDPCPTVGQCPEPFGSEKDAGS